MIAKPQRLLAALLFSAALLPLDGEAQLPIERDHDIPAITSQAEDLFVTLREPVKEVAKSSVEVRVWQHRVAYGTVVGKERVLSKWSEVMRDVRSLSCRSRDGQWLPAKILGVYREEDLALLEVPGLDAPAVDLTPGEPSKLGSFLAMARPDGEVVSMGVVSVLPRSLRSADQGFLGVQMDMKYPGPGILVLVPQEGSAANHAGVQPDDVILKINDREVNGSFELRSVLQNLNPGDEITITYRRGKKEITKATVLGSRPQGPRISRERMERMNNLGGIHQFSRVKSGFRSVLQTDMPLKPEDCGAPVVDLDGNLVGIAVARAARIKSYILPTVELVGLLERDPEPVKATEMAGKESAESRKLRELLRHTLGRDPTPREMRHHREEFRRLMQEMEELEP